MKSNESIKTSNSVNKERERERIITLDSYNTEINNININDDIREKKSIITDNK